MNKTYILWGIGRNAEKLCDLISNKSISFAVDSNPDRQGSLWHGIPVYSPARYHSMSREQKECHTVLVTPTECGDILVLLKETEGVHYVTLQDFLDERFRHEFLTGSHDCIIEDILRKIQDSKRVCYTLDALSIYKIIEIISDHMVTPLVEHKLPSDTDLLLFHGLRPDLHSYTCLRECKAQGIPFFFVEDGFISSIEPLAQNRDGTFQIGKFQTRYSAIFDVGTLPINAYTPSYIESVLTSDFVLTEKDIAFARIMMRKIITNHISKYNHQSITAPRFHHDFPHTVLVVDQVCGDKSIEYGVASSDVFSEMLHAAILENPNAYIIVKTHPAKGKGHFSNLESSGRLHLLTDGINPITLLRMVDKVYVCTSQMGFEAVMCGKEVHVFGLPFYAGWGVTFDRQQCSRRRKHRTVEEIFYVAYILGTVYVSMKRNCVCDINEAIDEIIELRDEYWKTHAGETGK